MAGHLHSCQWVSPRLPSPDTDPFLTGFFVRFLAVEAGIYPFYRCEDEKEQMEERYVHYLLCSAVEQNASS